MTMASSHGLKAHQQAFYQEVFENIHDQETILEMLDSEQDWSKQESQKVQ